MRGKQSRKDRQQPQTTASAGPGHRLRFDWTLLLYPACVLAALVVLYVVNHTIERELPLRPGRDAAQRELSASGRRGQSASATADKSEGLLPTQGGPVSQVQNAGETVDSQMNPPGQEEPVDSLAAAPTDEIRRADLLDHLQGPAKTVAMLLLAVEEKDHTRIKQCMSELALLGDTAVVPLNDLVNAGGEAGLWAAEALARIGTPMAATALLDTLAQTKEGSFKEELGRRVSGISNHDSWPVLLDSMVQTGDATVARATGSALARMADTPVIDEIVARYDAAATEAEIERLAQLVHNIQSPKATDALLSLAGDVTAAPQDSLQQAAIDALAKVGDAQCVSHLLQRLETAAPGEGTSIYNAITQVSNPDAHSQLLYAAAGNKEVSAESGRAAAIQALANYPNEETVALLERIVAQEANEKVVTAASRTLDDIRRAPHVVTAKADSLKKSEEMLPIKPLIK